MSLLATAGLTAFYGDFQALFGIDLAVEEGEAVAIIGANGAGKSTLLRTICGLLPARPERIRYRDRAIGALAPPDILALGIALVPEGRRLFPSLTVEENLLMGTQCGRKGPWHLERVYGLFPILRERRRMAATALSGGQQQMAAVGRALMSNPTLLLCDELSLGLAPIVVKEIYAYIRRIVAEGVSAVIVEQDISQALKIADHVYCMLEGRVALSGPAATVTREAIAAAYFGV